MPLVILKIVIAVFIFLISMISGFFALSLHRSKTPAPLKWWMRCISPQSEPSLDIPSFAGGVFLGMGLLHLLPDAQVAFSHMGPHFRYHHVGIALLAMLVFFMIERIGHGLKTRYQSHPFAVYLLILLLSYHSIIAGAALGNSKDLSGLLVIFLAIIAHKGLVSFALTSKLTCSNRTRKQCIIPLTFFSSMTPLGILATTMLFQGYHAQEHAFLEGMLCAFSAGTFLYLGMGHQHIGPLLPKNWLHKFLGLLLIAALSWCT